MPRNGRRFLLLTGGVMSFAFFLAPRCAAPAEPDLAQLVEQLDDDEFAARDRAERLLLARGAAALPALLPALESSSREIASRARRMIRVLHHRVLVDDFRKLGASTEDEQIDIETGMFLISRIGEPLLKRETITRQLDALATEVRKHIATVVKDRSPTMRDKLDALRHVLFVEHGFRGHLDDYANPDNSSLARVLETERGLPITLSQLTIAVGRRVGMPLHGLGLPRRFLVWYSPPPGQAAEETILDPFDAGRSLTRDDLEDLLASLGTGFDQMADLKAATHRETIERALRNLSSHYEQAGRDDLAADCDEYAKAFGAGAHALLR